MPRMRYRLRASLIACAVIPAAIWATYLLFHRPMPTPTIATTAEFDSAIAAERPIIHLDVDWSLHAVQSRPVIESFRQRLENDSRYRDVVFRRVDCSDQEGPLWVYVNAWFQSQTRDTSPLTSGNGEVLWSVNGQLVEIVRFPVEAGDKELLTRTTKVFARD